MYVLATALCLSVCQCLSRVVVLSIESLKPPNESNQFPAKFSYDIVDSQMRYSGTAKIMVPNAYFPQELCPKTMDLKNFATVTAKVCDSIVLSNMHRRPSMLTTCIYDDFLASRCYVYDMSVDRNAITLCYNYIISIWCGFQVTSQVTFLLYVCHHPWFDRCSELEFGAARPFWNNHHHHHVDLLYIFLQFCRGLAVDNILTDIARRAVRLR